MSQSRQEALAFVGLGAGVALFYYAPWPPLAGLGALLFLALAWVRLDLALIFVLFSVPFYLFPKTFGSLAFSLTEFTILASTLAWAGRSLYQRLTKGNWGLDLPPGWRLERPWESSPESPATFWGPLMRSANQGVPRQIGKICLGLSSPALLFLAAATLSLFFSQYLHLSLREYRVVVIEPLLFYLMLVSTLRGERAVWRMANALVVLGVAVSTVALYHYVFVGVVEATGGVRRLLAIYHSPNALGLFLGRVAPVALALGVGLPARDFSRGPLSARIRGWIEGRGPGWPYLVAVLPIGASLLLTFSRGAWIGVGVAVLLVAALRGRRALLALAGAAATALLAALPFLGLGRLVSGVTTSQRLYVWQSALKMIADRPWTGVGLDNFLYYYRDRGYMLPQAWAEPNVSHPHNILLDYWTRLGVLGVAALAWLQVSFWRRGLGLYWRLRGRSLQVVALALMASMADFLAHGLLDNSYFLIDLAVIFWLTYGLMEVMEKETPPQGISK